MNITHFSFEFPACSHFEFYDVIWLPLLLRSNFLLYATTVWAIIWHHKNSKWQRAGSSKAKIGDIHI